MSAFWAVRLAAYPGQPAATAHSIARVLLPGLLVPLFVAIATAERLPLRTYTAEDGLAHARVRRIESDPRGFLWFCTIDGLSRFDGAEFVTYRTSDGLPDPWVTDLLTTRDGVYLVATNDGVARFDALARRTARDAGSLAALAGQEFFKRVAIEGSPTLRQVRVLLEDRAGLVWAGGRGGLSVLDSSKSAAAFQPVTPSPPAITSLLVGRDDSLWIGTQSGLFQRLRSGEVLPEPRAASAGVRNVRALAADNDGRLWIGHDDGLLVLGPGAGVPQLAPSTAMHLRDCGAGPARDRRLRLPGRADDACALTAADGLIDHRVRSLSLGSAGRLFVATSGGLSVVDGSQLSSLSQAHGLADDAINTIAEDRDGNLWLGTDASGAMRIAAHGLASYFQADGLRHDHVPSLIEDDAGRVIAVSGAHYTINEFDGRRFVSARFNVPRGLPSNRFFSVIRDHRRAWWVGTASGLYRFPPDSAIADVAHLPPDAYYSGLPTLPSSDVFPLVEDSRGDIWLIAQLPDHVRLVRWRRSTDDFEAFDASHGLPLITTRPSISRPAIIESPDGELFFGFREAGLFVYRDGRFQAILDQGQPVLASSLHLDRVRRLWIVGVDSSVRRIDDLSTRRLVSDPTIARSLSGANVRCMVEDARGHIYFGTTSGVIEVDPRTGHAWHYTTAEGLAQNEVWSALVTRRGDIWFGTIAGVSRLDATRSRPPVLAPPALITTVHVNGEPRLLSELGDQEVSELTLAPGERRVAIGFLALSFAPGERLRYQYRLDGSDAGWSRPSAERVVHYSHLGAGGYRFQVRAVTSAGLVSETPALVAFEILPPLSQRWWFRTALLLGVVMVAFAAHRYRVARLLALERVRMRIAADLHDDIGGSLSRISIQSEVARREATALGAEPARRFMEIADTARGLIDALGDVVWSVDPRRDDLASVCRRVREYADDVLAASGVRWSYVAPANLAHLRLDPQARRNLFLLLKEGITNVARHASARNASLEIRLVGYELQADLCDDGCGFDMGATDTESEHRGILSMRTRAERLGARLTIESSRGAGTLISVRLPIAGVRERIRMLLFKRLR